MPHFEFFRNTPEGLEIYYEGWEPAGPCKGVVCLVHGLGEYVGRYAHVAAALNEAGFALMGYDQCGHGHSAGPRGHVPPYDAVMAQIDRFLDEAAVRYPARPRFLYGHSMGGGLVLNYALRRDAQSLTSRLAGVIATSPALRTTEPLPAAKMTAARVLNRVLPGMRMANGLDLAAISRDPEVTEAYRADPLIHDRASARLGLALIQNGEWALAHAAGFPPIPLLLMHGTADRITSAAATQEFAARVRGECTLKLWDGLYHETHNEPEKAQVLGTIVAWLRSHMPAKVTQ